MHRKLATLFLLVPLATACGDDTSGHGGHTPADAAPTDNAADQVPAADAAVTPDAPADGGAEVPLLNDCRASDYEDRTADAAGRTVVPRGSTGYTPRCLIVRAGQSVTFEMDFAAHPLVPGVPHGSSVGATSPNLIEARSTGTMAYTVTFPGAGYFPFYCSRHGHVGMAGVVRVIP